MSDKNQILSFVLSYVKINNLRHEVHEFSSGAVIIDLWKSDKFYVVQIDRTKIGFSVVNEINEFTSVPDDFFFSFEAFKNAFNSKLEAHT